MLPLLLLLSQAAGYDVSDLEARIATCHTAETSKSNDDMGTRYRLYRDETTIRKWPF